MHPVRTAHLQARPLNRLVGARIGSYRADFSGADVDAMRTAIVELNALSGCFRLAFEEDDIL